MNNSLVSSHINNKCHCCRFFVANTGRCIKLTEIYNKPTYVHEEEQVKECIKYSLYDSNDNFLSLRTLNLKKKLGY